MKLACAILTAFWVGFAVPSPVLAQDRAKSRVRPSVQERIPYDPSGLALASPYTRGKIPVVFVHGLWATPASWRPMIAALVAAPAIDGRFQFWTFGYSTGNPIPYSAYLLRRDLDEVRRRLDPGKTDPAFDRMVLVGHSMGGLLCKMVAVDSGHQLWKAVSNRPTGELRGEREDIKLIRDCLIFDAHPGVRRVIYSATPHRGSRLDRGSFQAIGKRLVCLPDPLRAAHRRLIVKNPPDFFREPFRRRLPSSIDELGWDSPLLKALSELAHPPALQFHSIIAVRPHSPPADPTDGVVSYGSAHVAGAASEKLVSAGHLCQEHPAVIGEVCRILREHLEATADADRGGFSQTGSFSCATQLRGALGLGLDLVLERVDAVPLAAQLPLGHQLVPDAGRVTRRRRDAADPRCLVAAAQARLVVQAHHLQPLLEGLVRVFPFLFRRHA